MAYLLFTAQRDDRGRPLLHCETVVRCYGVKDRRGARVSAERLLELFKRDVLSGFQWSGYHPKKERCRIALSVPVKSEIKSRLNRELKMRPSSIGNYVNLITGRKIDAKYITNVRKEAQAEVQGMDEPCSESKRWAEYMNSRPADLYTRDAQRNLADAWEKVEELPEGSQDGARRHLQALETQPKPIYKYNDTTCRITATTSLQTINSTLRVALVGDVWVTYDLSSAQLAIASVDWGADGIAEFLLDGGDVWDLFAEETGLPLKYKPVFKKGLYSTCYGANPENIRFKHMADRAEEKGLEYDPDEEGERILSVPFLEELIDARKRKWCEIEAEGGAVDCFGRHMDLGELQREHGKTENGAIRTVLANLNQSKEMDLLSPALDLAIEEEENSRAAFQIALYEYDGFSVKYHYAKEHHHKRIMRAVNRKCRREGYPTELEVE
ncbi:hypothetical protein [Salinibacter altiplanensis]|uniref:hypothetical protein n=1 Tax=Salinibacter altiplanensis TaxID=1803181 RepID=UPI000C9F158F|nr:hypothetical protein [Salinibacter altiplanensis]